MLKRFLLIVLPLFLVCSLLEIVFRTAHPFGARVSWTEPDREIGWRFTPGREYWFFGENDHAITGHINSMGWRDRERTVRKRPRTYRIAVLGDSYVEAFQVEQDSTFTAIAERRLNATRAHDDAEVMNFGRSGMSPTEESIVLERDVLPCHPDMVLLLFTPHNDIADVNPATAPDPCRPFFRTRGDSLVLDTSFTRRRDFRIRESINSLKQHSALVSLVTERYNAWRLTHARKRVNPLSEKGLTREQRMCTTHPDSVYVANYVLCKRLIVKMAHACKARGVRFELASVPLVYADEDVARCRAIDPTFDPGFFDRDLAALATAGGFSFYPMTAEFAARSGNGVRLQWQHWSYLGHQAAFEVLLGPGPVPPPAQNGKPVGQ
jgi:hypothetical protein